MLKQVIAGTKTWESTLRFYLKNGQVIVKMNDSQEEYGNEYLGNKSQLVITPLTDKAYSSILTAKQNFLCSAPQGPAGTGKTETTKDLARALGKNCVIVNSSDQLTEKETAEIFKGCLASGSWVCFDEFNRITLDVLEKIREQLQIIKKHREDKKGEIEDFCGSKNLKEWVDKLINCSFLN